MVIHISMDMVSGVGLYREIMMSDCVRCNCLETMIDDMRLVRDQMFVLMSKLIDEPLMSFAQVQAVGTRSPRGQDRTDTETMWEQQGEGGYVAKIVRHGESYLLYVDSSPGAYDLTDLLTKSFIDTGRRG